MTPNQKIKSPHPIPHAVPRAIFSPFAFTFLLTLLFALPSARAAEPLPSPTDFQKGVSYTAWFHGEYSKPQSDETLSKLIKPMGVNWIALIVTCTQPKIDSTGIQCHPESSTPSDDDLRHVVRVAHDLGIRVMLKPHIDLSDDPGHWRGQITVGADDAAWAAWFASYTAFITHYASLAHEIGADSFCVGTELVGTSRRSAEWRAVIQSVRAKFSGPVLYAANWGEESRIDWWDALDSIGVDAYYPLLLAGQPTLEQLTKAWAPIVARLGRLSEQWNRPVVFTEIGYRSMDGAHREPGNWANTGAVNLQLQADCYQAVFDAFAGKPWWRGVFWWNWTPDPAQGGPSATDYTANNKPAEAVLRKHYATPVATSGDDFNHRGLTPARICGPEIDEDTKFYPADFPERRRRLIQMVEKCSFDEWFTRFDADHNGYLDPSEIR